MLLEEIKERMKLICPQFGYTPTRSATLDSVIDGMDTTCFVSSSILFLTQVFLFFSFKTHPTPSVCVYNGPGTYGVTN